MIDIRQIVRSNARALENRNRLAATLADLYPNPENQRDINQLLMVYDCGIVAQLRGKQAISMDELSSTLAKVEASYGVSKDAIRPAVLAWCKAFGMTLPAGAEEAPPSAEASAPAQPAMVDLMPPAPLMPAPGASYVPDPRDFKLCRYSASDDTSMDEFDATRAVEAPKRKGWFGRRAAKPDGFIVEQVDTPAMNAWEIERFVGFEEKHLVVPSEIDGKKIVSIGAHAFAGFQGIEKVYIMDGIKRIGKGAFFDCASLVSVRLPSTLERIGDVAFCCCNLTGHIVLPGKLQTIGKLAFASSEEQSRARDADHDRFTTSWDLPASLTRIGDGAFYGNRIASFRIAPGLTRLGNIFTCEIYNSRDRERYGLINYGQGITHVGSLFIPSSVMMIVRTFPSTTYSFNIKFGVLYCEPGSAALEYARRCNIPFAEAYYGPDCPYGRPAS